MNHGKTSQLPSIAIIDVDSLLFSAAHGKKIYIEDNEFGEPIYERDEKGRLVYEDKSDKEMKSSFDDIMTTILTDTSSIGYVALIKGGSNSGKFRYDANPTYKSNRPTESPKWWGMLFKHAVNNWNCSPVYEVEVDDVVNIARLNIENSFIVAIDKDLLNLEGSFHYNWRTKQYIHVTKEEAERAFWRDVVVGQPADGLPGIPGKGQAFYEKNLSKYPLDTIVYQILKYYIDYYGELKGLEEMYKHIKCLKILDKFKDGESVINNSYANLKINEC